MEENFFLALEWIKNKDNADQTGQAAHSTKFRASVSKSPSSSGIPVAPPQPQDLAFSLSVGYVNNDLYLRSTSQPGNGHRWGPYCWACSPASAFL